MDFCIRIIRVDLSRSCRGADAKSAISNPGTRSQQAVPRSLERSQTTTKVVLLGAHLCGADGGRVD